MKRKLSFLKITEGLSYFSAILIGFIMILGVADIIGSKLFKHCIPETAVITELCHVIIVTAPLAYITLTRGHIDVDIIERRLPSKVRTAATIFTYCLGTLLSAFICYRGFTGFITSVVEGTFRGADVAIPIWFFYLMLVISFALTTIAFPLKLVEKLKKTNVPDNQL